MLNIVNIELNYQLKIHLLPHCVTLCVIYDIDHNDPQTGHVSEDHCGCCC